MLKETARLFKDILFPVFCVGCGKEETVLCDDCSHKIKISPPHLCPVCSAPVYLAKVCQNCQAVSALNGATTLFVYDEKSAEARLIKDLKYKFITDIKEAIEKIVSLPETKKELSLALPNFFDLPAGQAGFTVTPVPLHPRRQRDRGFNQAEIIADIFARIFNLPKINLLTRTKITIQQAKLSGAERRKNLAGVFAISPNIIIPPNIILIDDVFTTGTTMQECAKVLKNNGAKNVWGFALARG